MTATRSTLALESNWDVLDSAYERILANRDKLKVSVIIPTLNEEPNLAHVLPRIPGWVHEVILVDGGSTDGTLKTAMKLWPNKNVVMNERGDRSIPRRHGEWEESSEGTMLRMMMQEGRGKGAALRTGFAAASGDIIVMLDADGSMDPREIPAFIGPLLSGFDFVKGSRFAQGGGTSDMPFYRRMGNYGFVLASRLLFGSRYSDLCYGYNAFWGYVPKMLDLDADGFEIETLMNLRVLEAGLKVAEVPSFEAERIYGVGKLKALPDGWRVLKTIFRERFQRSGSWGVDSKADARPKYVVNEAAG